MDRKHLENAAAAYSYLRGLLGVPAGALLIVAALGNWAVGPFRSTWFFVVSVLALGGAGLAIVRYYREHYGRISVSARHEARTAVAAALGVAVMIGAEFLARSNASWSLDLPVNPPAIGIALCLLIYSGLTVGPKIRYLVIWGGLFVVGAVPLWNGGDPSNVGLVLAGFAAIAAGIVDHVLFVRTFGPPRLQLENGDVGA
jgi:hypothetical protein